MNLRNFTHTFRRFALASTLNVLGLAVAFASFFVIMTQVDYDVNFNKGIRDHNRVFQVTNILGEGGSDASWFIRPLIEMVATASPHVEAYSAMSNFTFPADIENDEGQLFSDVRIRLGHGNFLDVAQPTMRVGTSQCTSNQALLPVSLAIKMFGSADCAGRTLYLGAKADGNAYTVAGVFDDFAANSTFAGLLYLSYEEQENLHEWGNNDYAFYVRLDDDANLDAFLHTAIDRIKRECQWQFTPEAEAGKDHFLGATPLTEVHFSPICDETPASSATLLLLITIAVVIVVVAIINYMNFNLGETPMRIRSINTQKVLGAGVGALRRGLVMESIAVSLCAWVVSVVIVGLLRTSVLSDIVEGDIAPLTHPVLLGSGLIVSILAGILAGLYPAIYATSIPPAIALKGSFGLSKSGRTLRTGLVCLQFAVGFMLVVCTFVMYQQHRHIHSADYGFDKDAIVVGQVPENLAERDDAVVEELKTVAGVEAVAFSEHIISTDDTYATWAMGDRDKMIYHVCIAVDHRYAATMGIEMTEGRDFRPGDDDVFIFNEAARKAFPWLRVDERALDTNNSFRVLGFFKDIKFRTFCSENANTPLAFAMSSSTWTKKNLNKINIRVARGTSKATVIEAIEAKLMEMNGTDADFHLRYLDDAIQEGYVRENRLNKQIKVFALISIAICIVGVFGMTMFECEYRRKEIGLRKILGSTTRQILGLLCRRYVWLLAGSYAVGAPLGVMLSQTWLEAFADKVSISPWALVASFAVVSGITMVTVVVQAWSVATSNPSASIKES